MSAISEMCSRVLLSRTRFAKQKKKKTFTPHRPFFKKKKRYSLFFLHSFSLSSTPSLLQEKMFKNGVLVTSGEQGAREWWWV